MKELQFYDNFSIAIPFEAVAKRLYLTDEDDLAMMEERFAEALRVARPKAAFRACDLRGIEGGQVQVEDALFSSEVLAGQLAGLHRVYAYVVTCGTEVDEWTRGEEDAVVALWLDGIKEMILNEARRQFFALLRGRYGMETLSSMSPGSGDLEVWPITQQKPLFALLRGAEAATGVRLTDSCLMLPTKSVSGLAYPAEVSFVTCRMCSRADCPGRKAPSEVLV